MRRRSWWRFFFTWTTRFAVFAWIVLLLIASVGWVRSHWRADSITGKLTLFSVVDDSINEVRIRSDEGLLAVGLFRTWSAHLPEYQKSLAQFGVRTQRNLLWSFDIERPSGIFRMWRGTSVQGQLGFYWDRTRNGSDNWILTRRVVCCAPYWAVVVPMAIPVPFAARVWWRHRQMRLRRARGQCPECVYDLRATPDRCPECGAVRAAEELVTETVP